MTSRHRYRRAPAILLLVLALLAAVLTAMPRATSSSPSDATRAEAATPPAAVTAVVAPTGCAARGYAPGDLVGEADPASVYAGLRGAGC